MGGDRPPREQTSLDIRSSHVATSQRADRAARRARAFADATRLTLAAALAQGDELCVCNLAWVVERAENLVSHHLRLLRSDGLVASRPDGRMVIYSLTPAGRELLAQTLAQEAPA